VTASGSGVDVLGMGVAASAGEVKVVAWGPADWLGRDGPVDGWATLLWVGGVGLVGTAFIAFIELFEIVACFAFSCSSVSISFSASSASSPLFLFLFSLIIRTPASLACLYMTYLKLSIRNRKGGTHK